MKEKCRVYHEVPTEQERRWESQRQGACLAPVLEPVWLEDKRHLVEKIKESS